MDIDHLTAAILEEMTAIARQGENVLEIDTVPPTEVIGVDDTVMIEIIEIDDLILERDSGKIEASPRPKVDEMM